MRRFSFKIDLTKQGGGDTAPSPKRAGGGPAPQADGFQMSQDLQQQRQDLEAWPYFQRTLMALPELTDTLEEWEDPHLAAEYVRVYEVTRQKVVDAEPGFTQQGKTESHCFFTPDGAKHLVSRLLSQPETRVNEIRLSPDGTLVRLYYENTQGPTQSTEDLYEHGLTGLEEEVERFRRYPNYVMRFFLLVPEGEFLKSTFRGVCYYDAETDSVITEEAGALGS